MRAARGTSGAHGRRRLRKGLLRQLDARRHRSGPSRTTSWRRVCRATRAGHERRLIHESTHHDAERGKARTRERHARGTARTTEDHQGSAAKNTGARHGTARRRTTTTAGADTIRQGDASRSRRGVGSPDAVGQAARPALPWRRRARATTPTPTAHGRRHQPYVSPHGEEPVPEEKAGASASGDGVDVQLRRLQGDPGRDRLEDMLERTIEARHVWGYRDTDEGVPGETPPPGWTHALAPGATRPGPKASSGTVAKPVSEPR